MADVDGKTVPQESNFGSLRIFEPIFQNFARHIIEPKYIWQLEINLFNLFVTQFQIATNFRTDFPKFREANYRTEIHMTTRNKPLRNTISDRDEFSFSKRIFQNFARRITEPNYARQLEIKRFPLPEMAFLY